MATTKLVRVFSIPDKSIFNKVRRKLLSAGYTEHKHAYTWTTSIYVGYIGFICSHGTTGITMSPDEFLSKNIKVSPQVPMHLFKNN